VTQDLLIGLASLAVAIGLNFVPLPNRRGESPRFLQFQAAPMVYPAVVLVFLAIGVAELIYGRFHDLPFILGCVCFFAVNLYLWSLPIQSRIPVHNYGPLGILYFTAFMWYVLKMTSRNEDGDR
jgi:hypothetical protein